MVVDFRNILVLALILAMLLVLCAGGCTPSPTRGTFDDENSASYLYAITRAAKEEDHSKIPQIVDRLSSDDPAVRFLAIQTLEQLTGRTFGYRYYDPQDQRQQAIDRWVEFVKSEEPQQVESSERHPAMTISSPASIQESGQP